MTGIHLVACARQKRASGAMAADLYTSDLFAKARAYVEAVGGPWFILSARHGLLHPLQWVEPYDTTLADLSIAERRAWGARVAAQLDAAIGRTDGAIVLLAGRLYRQPLEPCIGMARGPARRAGEAAMIYRCHRCGETWPDHPVTRVPCPIFRAPAMECGGNPCRAPAGRPCRRGPTDVPGRGPAARAAEA